MATAMITAHLDEVALARLDELVGRVGRSRDAVATAAINRFVQDELELLASLDEAEAQIDRGEFYTQERVESWFDVRTSRSSD